MIFAIVIGVSLIFTNVHFADAKKISPHKKFGFKTKSKVCKLDDCETVTNQTSGNNISTKEKKIMEQEKAAKYLKLKGY